MSKELIERIRAKKRNATDEEDDAADLIEAQQKRIEQLEADTKEVNAARIYLREKAAMLQEMATSQAQINVLREQQKRIAELEQKNQNIFNALMLSTQKKDSMYASIKAASGHLNLYGLFSCVEGDSYDPECADKNVRKANSILKAELTTEIIKPVGKEDQAVCDSILKEEYK